MKRRILISLVAGGVVLTLNVGEGNAIAASAVPGDLSKCVQCHEDCEPNQHIAADSGTYTLPVIWTRNGGAHLQLDCRTGTCWTYHGPACGDQFTVKIVDRVFVAVAQRDIRTLGRLVADHPSNILFNKNRGALQLADCRGAIFAHIPVAANLLGLLTD